MLRMYILEWLTSLTDHTGRSNTRKLHMAICPVLAVTVLPIHTLGEILRVLETANSSALSRH